MKLNELQEKRGSLVKQAREILDAASTEKRALTSDEQVKFDNLEKDASDINATIDREMRQLALESKQGIKLNTQEQRDVNRFDLGKVLRHLNNGGVNGVLDGIEAEMIQEGAREARQAGLNPSGISLPRILVMGKESRAALSVTGGTTDQYGGELVATGKMGLLGDFYNSSVLEQSGAMVLNGLQGNIDLPRYVQGSAPAKKTENEAAGDVGGTFTALSLSPKRLAGYIDISDQLLLQSSSVLEAFIGAQLRNQLASVKEIAFFHGAGTNEPVGIAATSGIGSVAGGTNGAAPDYADMVNLWKAVAVDNADMGALNYYTNTSVIGKLLTTPKVSSTDSVMVLNDVNSSVLGRRVLGTNAVKSTLTKGSASGVCSAIFYGNAADFVVGYWGGINLEMVRDTTGAKAGQRTLVANTYYDAGVLRAQSFSAMLDALTT